MLPNAFVNMLNFIEKCYQDIYHLLTFSPHALSMNKAIFITLTDLTCSYVLEILTQSYIYPTC